MDQSLIVRLLLRQPCACANNKLQSRCWRWPKNAVKRRIGRFILLHVDNRKSGLLVCGVNYVYGFDYQTILLYV